VPADELAELNGHIRGPIRVVEAFVGDRFVGTLDPVTGLPIDLIV